jgi:hypothetical protein
MPINLPVFVNHGQTAHVLMQHQVCSFKDRGVGFHRGHLAGHNLICAHFSLQVQTKGYPGSRARD